jgi:hypothetical protein
MKEFRLLLTFFNFHLAQEGQHVDGCVLGRVESILEIELLSDKFLLIICEKFIILLLEHHDRDQDLFQELLGEGEDLGEHNFIFETGGDVFETEIQGLGSNEQLV